MIVEGSWKQRNKSNDRKRGTNVAEKTNKLALVLPPRLMSNKCSHIWVKGRNSHKSSCCFACQEIREHPHFNPHFQRAPIRPPFWPGFDCRGPCLRHCAVRVLRRWLHTLGRLILAPVDRRLRVVLWLGHTVIYLSYGTIFRESLFLDNPCPPRGSPVSRSQGPWKVLRIAPYLVDFTRFYGTLLEYGSWMTPAPYLRLTYCRGMGPTG